MKKCTVKAFRARKAGKTDKYARKGQIVGYWVEEMPGYSLELENGYTAHVYRDAAGTWWTIAPQTGMAICSARTRAAAVDAANNRAGALEDLQTTRKWSAYMAAFNEASNALGHCLAVNRYNEIMEGLK